MRNIQALVVDDDQQFLGLMDGWLTAAGYDVVACCRYEEARTYLAAHHPTVLIANVRLGAFNGLHLVLIAKDTDPATRAVVLSMHDDTVLRREARALGASYLVKPITSGQLLESLSAPPSAVPASN